MHGTDLLQLRSLVASLTTFALVIKERRFLPRLFERQNSILTTRTMEFTYLQAPWTAYDTSKDVPSSTNEEPHRVFQTSGRVLGETEAANGDTNDGQSQFGTFKQLPLRIDGDVSAAFTNETIKPVRPMIAPCPSRVDLKPRLRYPTTQDWECWRSDIMRWYQAEGAPAIRTRLRQRGYHVRYAKQSSHLTHLVSC